MKSNKHTLLILVISILMMISCDSDYNIDIEKELNLNDITPPGHINNLKAISSDNSVTISWVNPTEPDFEGINIRCTPPAGSLSKQVYIHDFDSSPNYKIYDLSKGINYTITLTTQDRNGNQSTVSSITVSLKGESTTPVLEGLSSPSFISYKLNQIALDFGYSKELSGIEKTFSLTNNTSSTIDFTSMKIDDNSQYSLVSIDPEIVQPEETSNITIKYKPKSQKSWDESNLDLIGDGTYKIKLIGSGFPQPKDINSELSKDEGGLALWLRPDLISENDIIKMTDSIYSIKRLPDYSDYKFDAKPVDNSYPTYNKTGINDIPTISFEENQYLITESSVLKPIINKAEGTTSFVIYKPKIDKYSSTRCIIYASYVGGLSYPCLYTTPVYWDEEKGYSGSYKATPATAGAGMSGNRYFYNTAPTEKNTIDFLSRDQPNAYSTTLRYDSTFDISVGNKDNIFIWQDGKKKGLSYTYSRSTNSIYKEETNFYYGAYGKPINDGNGKRHPDLINTNPQEGDRKCDFGFNLLNDLWSSADNPYYYYLKNRLSTYKTIAGTIATISLAYSPSYFYEGDIAEVFIFSAALTDEQIKQMNNYIYYRYNIGTEQE